MTGRNKDNMKQYKCQLAVYGHIIENNYKEVENKEIIKNDEYINYEFKNEENIIVN